MLNVEVQEERKFQNPVLTFSFLVKKISKCLVYPSLIRHTIGLDLYITTAPLFINCIRSNLPSSIDSLYDDISYLLRRCYTLRSGRFVVGAVSQ